MTLPKKVGKIAYVIEEKEKNMANEITEKVETQNEVITLQKRQFDALVAGGFLPKGCSSNEGFARIVAGAQMGMKPIQALNGIAMINGHPTLHSDSIPCVVMASGLVTGMKYKFTGEGDALACTFYIRRKGVEEYQEWTYSMEDARKAGLMNNPVWKNHTKKMLFNRARTWCMRNTFPDVIGNVYTKDEIEDVDFDVIPEKPAVDDSNAEDRYKTIALDQPDKKEEPPQTPVQEKEGQEDDWTLTSEDNPGEA